MKNNSKALVKIILYIFAIAIFTFYFQKNINANDGWQKVLSNISYLHNTKVDINFKNIEFGNDRFIVIGNAQNKGFTFLSRDGINWEENRVFNGLDIRGMQFLNDKFYIFGRWVDPIGLKPSEQRIYSSATGYNWQSVVFKDAGAIRSIAYGNDMWVIVTGLGGIVYSNDFENWTHIDYPKQKWRDDEMKGFRDVVFGKDSFIAVGNFISAQGHSWGIMAYSEDGVNWEPKIVANENIRYAPSRFVRFINGKFFAGDSQRLCVSYDGKKWYDIEGGYGSDIAYGDDLYILISQANYKKGILKYTKNLVDLSKYRQKTFTNSDFKFLSDIVSDDKGFVSISDEGIFYRSFKEDLNYIELEDVTLNSDLEVELSKGKNEFFRIKLNDHRANLNYGYRGKNDLPYGLEFNSDFGYVYGVPTQIGRWKVEFFIEDTKTDEIFVKNVDIVVKQKYKLTLDKNIKFAGSLINEGYYAKNENVLVRARPFAGYTFLNWSENGTVLTKNKEYSFNINEDRNLIANFIRTSEYFPYYGYEKWENDFTIRPDQSFVINFNNPLSLDWIMMDREGIYVKDSNNEIVPTQIFVNDSKRKSLRISAQERFKRRQTYYLYINNNVVTSRRSVGALKLPRTIVVKFKVF